MAKKSATNNEVVKLNTFLRDIDNYDLKGHTAVQFNIDRRQYCLSDDEKKAIGIGYSVTNEDGSKTFVKGLGMKYQHKDHYYYLLCKSKKQHDFLWKSLTQMFGEFLFSEEEIGKKKSVKSSPKTSTKKSTAKAVEKTTSVEVVDHKVKKNANGKAVAIAPLSKREKTEVVESSPKTPAKKSTAKAVAPAPTPKQEAPSALEQMMAKLLNEVKESNKKLNSLSERVMILEASK